MVSEVRGVVMDTMDKIDVHCVHSQFSVFVGCVHIGKWTQWTQCVHPMDTMDMSNGHNGRPLCPSQWTQWTQSQDIKLWNMSIFVESSIGHNGQNGHPAMDVHLKSTVSNVSITPARRPILVAEVQ